MEKLDAIIVGGGQAGLSASYLLSGARLKHVVLEKGTIAQTWQSHRWDSFRVVQPNWTLQLPGFVYSGNDPDGFMPKSEVVRFLEDYAKSFGAPVNPGVQVHSLSHTEDGYLIETNKGEFRAPQVIVATGPYHEIKVPRFASELGSETIQINSSHYRNPSQLKPGSVLVVGTGQSGAQIADELHESGRKVFLSVSRCLRAPRHFLGRDVIWWLSRPGFDFDQTPDSLSSPNLKYMCRGIMIGDKVRELNLREFASRGITLLGRLEGLENGMLRFAEDLQANLDFADSEYYRIRRDIYKYALKNGYQVPVYVEEKNKVDLVPSGPLNLDVKGNRITNVIWCTGYKFAFDWIKLPLFDQRGAPRHLAGVTEYPGLYFLGLPWLRKKKSDSFCGVADDAKYVTQHLINRHLSSTALG